VVKRLSNDFTELGGKVDYHQQPPAAAVANAESEGAAGGGGKSETDVVVSRCNLDM
jgi:hypothetical protein